MTKEWMDAYPEASPMDVALHAEGVTGKTADLARSVYLQESGGGKNTKTSNAGAVGGMQILRGTFKEVADEGWDISDPVHNARAGVRYVAQMMERAGGDPALAAAGYYGGPGGLEKARAGVAVSDPRNPNAPNTLEYGKQVADRLPKAREATSSGSATKTDASWMNAYPEVDVRDDPAPPAGGHPKKVRSTTDEVVRQVGLTARAGLAGLASLPAMAADALIVAPVNAGLDLVRGQGKGYRLPQQTQALNEVLTAAGVPQPENATERVVQDAASAMAGGGAMVKGGQILAGAARGPIAKAVGEGLAAGPKTQVVGGATGAGAAGTVREEGGGTGAQVAAGIAGALAPSAAAVGGQAALRGVLRGGETGRQRVAETVKAFQDAADTMPTLGQATAGRWQQAAESTLAKVPGSSGIMERMADQQATKMAASVQKLADELAPGSNAMQAGEAISSGVNQFKTGMQQVQRHLYDELDKHIPAGTRIASDRTRAALADLNADIAGAPELSKWFKNARIQGIEGGLRSDTGSVEAVLSRPGVRQQAEQLRTQLTDDAARIEAANAERRQLGMRNLEAVPTPAAIEDQVTAFLEKQIDARLPYESVKKLRTLVGRELADNSLTADVPRSKWSALYGALSDDLGDAAKAAGPEAEKRWNWANKYTSSQMERLEALKSIVGRDAPEKVFAAALQGTAEGNTIVKRVFSALPQQNRREVAAAVLQRLGRATAGNQNEAVDVFSSETFLTNLAKLSPAARETIFARLGVLGVQKKLAQIGKIAEARREGGKVFQNPSGTARAAAQAAGLTALFGAIASGNPTTIAGALAIPAAMNGAARLVTRPATVKFAAERTALSPGLGATAAAAGGAAGEAMVTPLADNAGAIPPDAFVPAAEPGGLGDFSVPAQAVPGSDAIESGATPDGVPTAPPAHGEPLPQRIERLRAGGEDQMAAMLQGQHTRAETAGAVRAELQGMHEVAPNLPFARHPEFSRHYEEARQAGVKPAEAAARAGMTATMQIAGAQLGLPDKAVTPAIEKAKTMPLDAVPQFVQRYVQALAARGVIPQSEVTGKVAGMLEAVRDRAAGAVIDSAYRVPAPVEAEAEAQATADIPAEDPLALEEEGSGTVVQAPEPEIVPDAPTDLAAHAAATSPHNDLPEPTEAQAKAGNYAKGHTRIAGLDVSIENPVGSLRRGVDADGQPWKNEMAAHYGYLRQTRGADGDHHDVFIKPGTPSDFRGAVYVVDQIDPRTGLFDEHKTVIGAANEQEAEQLYLANYADGWEGMGAITRLPMAAFRAWVKAGTTKDPLGDPVDRRQAAAT